MSPPEAPCALCGVEIDGEPVVCPVCDSPHHAECHECAVGCAALGCPGSLTHRSDGRLDLSPRHGWGAAGLVLVPLVVAFVVRPEHLRPATVGASLFLAAVLIVLGVWGARFLLRHLAQSRVLPDPRPLPGSSLDLATAQALADLASTRHDQGRSLALVVLGLVPPALAVSLWGLLALDPSPGSLPSSALGWGLPLALSGLVPLVPGVLLYLGASRRAAAALSAMGPASPLVPLPSPGVEQPRLVRRLALAPLDRRIVDASLYAGSLALVGAPLIVFCLGQLSDRAHLGGPGGHLYHLAIASPALLALVVIAAVLDRAGRHLTAAATLRVRLSGHRLPPGSAPAPEQTAPLDLDPHIRGVLLRESAATRRTAAGFAIAAGAIVPSVLVAALGPRFLTAFPEGLRSLVLEHAPFAVFLAVFCLGLLQAGGRAADAGRIHAERTSCEATRGISLSAVVAPDGIDWVLTALAKMVALGGLVVGVWYGDAGMRCIPAAMSVWALLMALPIYRGAARLRGLAEGE